MTPAKLGQSRSAPLSFLGPRPTVAIVGTGPTGLYALAQLLAAPLPPAVTLWEAQGEAGWGSPYAPGLNDPLMLSNIASIELPPLGETLLSWLRRQPPEELARLGVEPATMDDRTFHPRVVLGEYFRAGLARLLRGAERRGAPVTVRTHREVTDLAVQDGGILLAARAPDGAEERALFDHVVVATGHDWPDRAETAPLFFASPWPAHALKRVPAVHLGIRGTSLSAIDALVAVAGAHGAFLRDASGTLRWFPGQGAEGFRATLMSRKGILPEADFHVPIPYEPNVAVTPEAVDALVASGRPDLLDALWELLREEIVGADPDWAAGIGLAALDADTFPAAWFAPREARDPFAWAALNLAEARAGYERRHTVPWRYALLRAHEVVERAVPHLSPEDRDRFDRGLRQVFVDDYATVPHESVERLLALRAAGRLDVLRLGSDYDLRPAEGGGAVVAVGAAEHRFAAFVDATGQGARPVEALPFPTLLAQGAVRPARARPRGLDEGGEETAGVELDDAFRPLGLPSGPPPLHLLALPFLLPRRPFAQGLTGAEELGRTAARAILGAAPVLVSP